jgi:hypothetical protein
MIQYEGHALARNNCAVEGDLLPDPGGDGAGGRHVVSDKVESGQVDSGLIDSGRREAAGDDTDYARSLLTLIQSEIIPRLMVTHATVTPAVMAIECETVIGAGEIEAFAPLVLQVEVDALLAHVEAILARGIAIDTVLVDLLAPTARLLGALWEDERCDFVDVTMGLWRLQEIVTEISERLPAERRPPASTRRGLFVPNSGDQHSFGTVIMDDRFRRDGRQADRLSAAEIADLQRRVEDDWFDRIGLTVSNDCHIGRSPAMTMALRNVSRNPQG